MIADDPQAAGRDCDAIRNGEFLALAAHDVPDAHHHGQHTADQSHHDQELQEPCRFDPECERGKQFDVTAAHCTDRKQASENCECSQRNAELDRDVGPQRHAAGPPPQRCNKDDCGIQPIVDLATADIGKGCKQQRDCQCNKQSVLENFARHVCPPKGLRGTRATAQCLLKSNQTQEDGISHAQKVVVNPEVFDRRAIPATAKESVWHAPDGHAVRRIDWPAGEKTARGSILFLPGRGDAYEKYLETLHQWHEAGWSVTGADWRGQAGSGRLGNDPVTGHVDDFSVWVDDLSALWLEWKASTPGPHILAGHSMGGHIITRALVEKRVDPEAVVLSAPMLGFIGRLPRGLMHRASALIARLKGRTAQAWKWSEKPGEIPVGRINLLTHDKDRYEDELFWRKERPELVMGPGSWGWVERAYASMAAIFAPGLLESTQTPVLFVATSNDKLVSIRAIEDAVHRLPNGEICAFGKEAHHEILREVDPVRDRAMAAIAEFLDRVAAKP